MVQLTDLCAELLLHIASFLPVKDLFSTSLVSKDFNAITEQELYRNFEDTEKPQTLRGFIKGLLTRSERAKYVRCIRLAKWSVIGGTKHDNYMLYLNPLITSPYFTQPHKEEYLQLAEAAKNAGVITSVLPYEAKSSLIERVLDREYRSRMDENEDFWIHYLFDGNIATNDIPYDVRFCKILRSGLTDPLIVLLMAILPCLHKIQFPFTPSSEYKLQWRVPKHNFDNWKSLEVVLEDDIEAEPLSLEFFKEVISGRKLQSLKLSGFSGLWMDHHTTDSELPQLERQSLLPGSTNITKLDLKSCKIGKHALQTLLQACGPLTSFAFTKAIYFTQTGTIDRSSLVELLLPYKGTLREFYFDIYDFRDFRTKFPIREQLLSSMREFKALTFMYIDLGCFEDLLSLNTFPDPIMANTLLNPPTERLWERLPPSLQRITFFAYNYVWNTRQFEHLVSRDEEKLPSLTNVTIVQFASQSTLDDQTYDRNRLKKAIENRDARKPLQFKFLTRQEYRSEYEEELGRPLDTFDWCQ